MTALIRVSDNVAVRVGRAAIRALHAEVVLYPKPGLVSLVDPGSHRDMDAGTFLRSLFALRSYFRDIAAAGAEDADFAELRALGISAERRMLAATGGVNTHRGAIFCLGLLAAAAGRMAAQGRTIDGMGLAATVASRWGDTIGAGMPAADSHGGRAARRYGAGGARREAAEGFPTLIEVTLPILHHTLGRTGDLRPAMVQALFATMAVLEDTNLLHRGGLPGLTFAQAQAGRFLTDGGVFRGSWEADAVAIHHAVVERNLSPGGSADILAAAHFVEALEHAWP